MANIFTENHPKTTKKKHQKQSKNSQIKYFPAVWGREFVRALIGHPLEYLQCLEFSGTYSNQLLKVLFTSLEGQRSH